MRSSGWLFTHQQPRVHVGSGGGGAGGEGVGGGLALLLGGGGGVQPPWEYRLNARLRVMKQQHQAGTAVSSQSFSNEACRAW